MEDNQVTYPKEGTPQGGTISPLLSNILLYYVLDEWFTVQIQPLLKGTNLQPIRQVVLRPIITI